MKTRAPVDPLAVMVKRSTEMQRELGEPFVSARLTFNLVSQLFLEMADWFERYEADMVLLAFKPPLLQCMIALDACEQALLHEYGPAEVYIRSMLPTLKAALLEMGPDLAEDESALVEHALPEYKYKPEGSS